MLIGSFGPPKGSRNMAEQRFILRRTAETAQTPYSVGQLLAASGVIHVLDQGPSHLLVSGQDPRSERYQAALDGWLIVPQKGYERPEYPPKPKFRPGTAEEASEDWSAAAKGTH